MLIADDALYEPFQGREIFMRDAPENLGLDSVVDVAQPIAEIGHLLPCDIKFLRLDVGRNPAGCFADDLQETLDGKTQKQITGKLLIIDAAESTFDMLNCVEDMSHSVRERRRHVQKTSIMSSAMRSAIRGSSDRRMDACVSRPVASLTMCSTPMSVSSENFAFGST